MKDFPANTVAFPVLTVLSPPPPPAPLITLIQETSRQSSKEGHTYVYTAIWDSKSFKTTWCGPRVPWCGRGEQRDVAMLTGGLASARASARTRAPFFFFLSFFFLSFCLSSFLPSFLIFFFFFATAGFYFVLWSSYEVMRRAPWEGPRSLCAETRKECVVSMKKRKKKKKKVNRKKRKEMAFGTDNITAHPFPPVTHPQPRALVCDQDPSPYHLWEKKRQSAVKGPMLSCESNETGVGGNWGWLSRFFFFYSCVNCSSS